MIHACDAGYQFPVFDDLVMNSTGLSFFNILMSMARTTMVPDCMTTYLNVPVIQVLLYHTWLIFKSLPLFYDR